MKLPELCQVKPKQSILGWQVKATLAAKQAPGKAFLLTVAPAPPATPPSSVLDLASSLYSVGLHPPGALFACQLSCIVGASCKKN